MGVNKWQRKDGKNWKFGNWRMNLAFQVYKATKNFPKEEIYGITSQIRRSALSIPTNMVEGYSRKGDKELAHFINISLGSLAETKYLVYFSNRLGYLKDEDYQNLEKATKTLANYSGNFTRPLELNRL